MRALGQSDVGALGSRGHEAMTSVAALIVAALLGVAFSLKRVLRVDPASAIGGAQ